VNHIKRSVRIGMEASKKGMGGEEFPGKKKNTISTPVCKEKRAVRAENGEGRDGKNWAETIYGEKKKITCPRQSKKESGLEQKKWTRGERSLGRGRKRQGG